MAGVRAVRAQGGVAGLCGVMTGMGNDSVNAFHGRPLARHRAFWLHRDMDRPLLACNLGMYAGDHCPATMKAMPAGLLRPRDVPVAAFLEDCDRLHALHETLGDDYPFVASPLVYIPWMEAIMGCGIVASPTSVWATPRIPDGDDVRDARFWDPAAGAAWARLLRELLERLLEHSRGRYPVSATMLRGPADVMAAMMGAQRLPIALVDHPDEMRKLAALCGEMFVKTAEAQLDLLPESANGYMDGDRGFRVWAPAKVIWLQEDAMALLSPRLYRDLILPVDCSIAGRFEAVAFHLHGSALWAWRDLSAAPEIDVVELNFEAARQDIDATFLASEEIAKRKPLMLWKLYDADFWPWLDRTLERLSSRALSIQVTVEDPADGVAVVKGFHARKPPRSSRSGNS